jgi:hypothetical protein
VRFGNFLNQPVGTEHADFAADRSRAPAPFALREGVGARVQESSEISIAKSVDRKLATMDGGQQGMVVCLKGT